MEKTTPASQIKFGAGCLKIRRGVSVMFMKEAFPGSGVGIYIILA
jgi:hypothetical protein